MGEMGLHHRCGGEKPWTFENPRIRFSCFFLLFLDFWLFLKLQFAEAKHGCGAGARGGLNRVCAVPGAGLSCSFSDLTLVYFKWRNCHYFIWRGVMWFAVADKDRVRLKRHAACFAQKLHNKYNHMAIRVF